MIAPPARAALIVADNFNRENSNDLGATSTGGLTWNEQESLGSALRVSGNQLVAGFTTSGREYASVNLGGAPGYSTKLSENSGVVTWAINMRQTRTNPSGLNSGDYGVAFVLSASTADVSTATGYAVVLGGIGAPDPLRLVSFTGLTLNSQLSELTSGGAFSNNFLGIRVTYNPSGNHWSLYAVSGADSFSDPTLAVAQIGSTVQNSTYTSTALNHSGVFWNHGTSLTDVATFDNFSISVSAVPEPAEWGILSAIGLLGVAGLRSWRLRRPRLP